MSWNLIVSTGGGNAGGVVTTSGVDTTGTDFIVVVGSCLDSNPGVVTDSNSNTWLTAVNTGDNTRTIGFIYYSRNPTVGPGHTFTWATSGATGTTGSFQVLAYSGSFTSSNPLDQINSTSYGSGTTSEQAGSITPTQSNELIVFGTTIDDPSGSSFAINSGFTIQEDTDVTSGVMFGSLIATLVQVSAAAVNPALTRTALSSGRFDWAMIASFKGAGGTPTNNVGTIGRSNIIRVTRPGYRWT